MDNNRQANSPAGMPGESTDGNVLQHAQSFSVVLGGPLYQLLRKSRLTDDAMLMVRKRIIVISLFAWLPLFLLSALEGHLLSKSVAVPFFMDIEVHIRYLVALPLLILAELVVNQRLSPIAPAFLKRHLIPESAVPRFDEALTSALRLRNSVLAEVVLIALVYAVGILVVWRQYTSLHTATWYGTPSASGTDLSLAGMWYGYVSLPIFQFLLIRWYFRIFIWAKFLWKVSRIELSLIPTHPDRVGGLGFLSNIVYAFGVLSAAHGAIVASQLANRIFFLGSSLLDFKAEIALLVVFLLCLVFGPLLVFAPQLMQAKRVGLGEYGTLAERYVREFDSKWLRGGVAGDEPLVGSADIQSLADLGNSFEVIQTMRIAPVTKGAIVQLAATALIPIAPLALTMMSLEDLLKKLFGILF